MPLKILLIDDEKHSLDVLEWELQGLEIEIESIRKCSDPIQGLDLINTTKPDIVFLDIEMPNLSGIQLMQKIEQGHSKVVFTTAYDQYGIEAVKLGAADYLLKPIQKAELAVAIERCKRSGIEQLQEQFAELHATLSKSSNPQKVVMLPTSEGIEFVRVDTIIRCESDSNYTTIYRQDIKPLVIAKTLKSVHASLDDPSILRIHKSHLVNFRHISRFVKTDGGYLVLADGSKVPVSRNKKGDFLGNK